MTRGRMVQAQNPMMKQKEGKHGYLPKWAHVINAPLSEGAIPTYLDALRTSLDNRHVPSPMIVQSLVYFNLVPPTLPYDCPSPIELLEKIRSHHLTDLKRSECLPTYPKDRDTPRWLVWEANSPTERNIQRYMSQASDEGIWGLLWDQGGNVRRKRVVGMTRRRIRGRGRERVRVRVEEVDDEDDGDEEEEGKVEKRVSQQGWILLEWLVGYWEEDQKQSGLGYSPAFLAQLPKQRDMQYDNPSLPLTVIQSALSHPDPSCASTQSEIASKLMALLINTAIPPSPPFHPSTLVLSLLPLLRTRLPGLSDVLSLFRRVPTPVYAHLLIHAIEDLAGLRATKAAERRSRRKPNQPQLPSSAHSIETTDIQDDFVSPPGQIVNLPPPTVKYTLKALLYPPKSITTSNAQAQVQAKASVQGSEEMMLLKSNLVMTMIRLYPEDPEWGSAKQQREWRVEFDKLCNFNSSGTSTPYEEEMRESILMFLDCVGSLHVVDDTPMPDMFNLSLGESEAW